MLFLQILLYQLTLTKESIAVSAVCFSIKYTSFTENEIYILGNARFTFQLTVRPFNSFFFNKRYKIDIGTLHFTVS